MKTLITTCLIVGMSLAFESHFPRGGGAMLVLLLFGFALYSLAGMPAAPTSGGHHVAHGVDWSDVEEQHLATASRWPEDACPHDDSSLPKIDDYHHHDEGLNPATGLPMWDGLDSLGNLYGMDGGASGDSSLQSNWDG